MPGSAFLRLPRSRLGRAVAASLVLHVAVLLTWRGKPPPLIPSAADDVEVQIVQVKTPPAPPATPAEAAPKPRPRRSAPTVDDRARPSSTAAPEAAIGRPEAAAATPESSLSLRDLPSAPVAESPSGGVLLTPSADRLARAGISLEAPAGVALPDDRIGKRRTGPTRWQKGMDQLARIEAARANQRVGKAPPETFELWRDLERRFEPTHDLVADVARAEAGRDGSARRWYGRYLGGFLEKHPDDRGKPFEREDAFNRAVKASAMTFTSRMCVQDGPDGHPIVESENESGPGSNVAGLDRIARDLVIQAAQRRAPGTMGGVRACFQFTARLRRVPPVLSLSSSLPIVACGLGKNGKPECAYPLKEIVETHVRLDGVESGAQAAVVPDAAAAQ